MSEQNPPRLQVRKIYLKDASFESPDSPNVFMDTQLQPHIDLSLSVNTKKLDDTDTLYEVSIHATVTATMEDKTIFLAEIHQGGIFEIHPDNDEHKTLMLRVACPNMLLPFAREEIASLIGKGGFPQVLISPINFESIYQQEQQAVAEVDSGSHTLQ